MRKLINKIVTEWAYRVHDGMPNVKNPLHLIHLEKALNELNLPRKVTEKLLQNLRELDFANQAEFDAYNKKHNMRKTTKVNIAGKETTAGDAEAASDTKDTLLNVFNLSALTCFLIKTSGKVKLIKLVPLITKKIAIN